MTAQKDPSRGQPTLPPEPGTRRYADGHSLADRCQARLSPGLQQLLHTVDQLGEEAGVRVYAVGGFVRDLLLGVKNEDLDLTVAGDGVAFAQRLATRIAGIGKGPSAFRTAMVIAPDGHKIDVATARCEIYQHPAALPAVKPGTIRNDLFRRDFSVNTMAFALNGPEAFILLDWYGGCADLWDGVLRVLHNRSFRDDPTRIFRAIRLEQRFGFIFHAHTLRLLHRAVEKGWIERLSGARLWRELRLMLEGESPTHGLARLDELGVLQQIDATLTLPPERVAVLTRVADTCAELVEVVPQTRMRVWLAYLAALLQGLHPDAIRRVCTRLALSPGVTAELVGGITGVEEACHRLQPEGDVQPSQIVAALRGLPLEMILLLLVSCPGLAVRERAWRYVTTLQHIRPSLTGDDVKRLGVPQGRQIGQLLAHLLAAKLDGEAPTRTDEEAIVQHALQQGPNRSRFDVQGSTLEVNNLEP